MNAEQRMIPARQRVRHSMGDVSKSFPAGRSMLLRIAGHYPIFFAKAFSVTWFRSSVGSSSMKKELRILMVEDAAPDAVLINHELRKAGLRLRLRRVETREAFLHELERHPPDVILSDHGVPGFDGSAALAEARGRCPEVPFIFVTGAPGESAEEEKLKNGADDYVLKTRLHLLGPAIERVLRDVSARARHHQLESALLDAEEHLRLVSAEFKEYAAFLLDGEGRVAAWNPGAERMLGYTPNEILGQDFARFFPEEAASHDWPRRLLERAASDGRADETGWRLRKGGERFRAGAAIVALRSRVKGEQGFLCVVRDLTRPLPGETAGESGRARGGELEAAHREMEQFAYATALELRVPLRHIEAFSELLHKSAGERLDPKCRGYLKTISESAEEMSHLIDDLFTFSRIGQTDMYRLHLSLAEIAKEVVHDLRSETEGRHIEWVIGNLPEVEGDPVMLWQVMTNLISNAVKFTRPREQARIEIDNLKAEGEVIVYVRDNGVGFNMHYANRLFGVFQRLHTQEFEGTGVGLANVRRIIERHGGRVWAEGADGEGATFYFSLPAGGGK
jgi:PAS domain S-box-containing protein